MTCSCYTNETSHCNDPIRPKRLIHSQDKSSYWQVRQKTGAIEAILQPCRSQTQNTRSSCVSISGPNPNCVTKTTSKIKFVNEPIARYKQCIKVKTKPQRARQKVPTESGVNCPCTRNNNKGSKFKNECYCIKQPNKPCLPGAPDCTVPPPDEVAGDEYGYRPETLRMAKDIIDYIPQSAFLNRMYRENCKKCMCNACLLNAAGSHLKYTERRLNLENAYHKIAECNRIDFDKLSRLNCVNISGLNISPECKGAATPATSCPESDDDCFEPSARCSTPPCNISDEQIHAVKAIRKQCFFDTHSSCALDPVEDHKCVFKYTVDERGLLAPLNPDAFGTNRCSICNKAQPEDRPKFEDTKDEIEEKEIKTIKNKSRKAEHHRKVMEPQKKATTTSLPKKQKSRMIPPLSPKPSNMKRTPKVDKSRQKMEAPLMRVALQHKRNMVTNPTSAKTVQLEVRNLCETIPRNNIHKIVAPVNSWALRYQKGVSA